MKNKLIQKIGDGSGKVVGSVLGGSIKLIGKAVKNDYVQEIGDSIDKASQFSCHTLGGLGQGVTDTVSGLIKKEKDEVYEGLNEIGETTWSATKTFGKGLTNTAKSTADVAVGVVNKDHDKTIQGLKNLGKVAAVGTIAFGIVDVIDGVGEVEAADLGDVQQISTINEHLEGTTHHLSDVSYEGNTVETPDGTYIEGVFPIFDSVFDAEIPFEHYESSDYTHAKIANDQLATAINQSTSLTGQFNAMQLEQIYDGETPDGYTWHHHEEIGKIQLVETEPHDQSGHTGGRSIWGGGSENR